MTNDRKLFYACFYAFTFCGAVMMTIGCALPDLRAAYSLSDSMSGALLSCYSLGNLASGVVWALIALYLGQKAAIMILASLVCVGMTVLVSTHAAFILFIACALVGLGRGSLISFSQRTMNIFTSGNPKVIGILHAFFAAGAIAAPLIFSALRVITWKAGIILVAVLSLGAVVIFASIRDYSELEAQSSSDSENRSLAFLRNKGFFVLASLMFLYLCCEFAVNGWLVTYMNHKNMTMNYSQMMAALLWIVMLIGRLICVWLAKYVSQKNIILGLSIGAAVFFACMLVSEGEVFIALSVACLGLCMSGISPVIYGGSSPYTNKYPLAMGVLFTIGCTGGAVMPLITGVIAENYGFDGGMSAILGAFTMLIVFAVINKGIRHEA